jgi:hypothetical protein
MMIDIGTKIIVYQPPWCDASGKEYAAGTKHRKIGVAVALTDLTCGSDRIVNITLVGEELPYPIWISELRHMVLQ